MGEDEQPAQDQDSFHHEGPCCAACQGEYEDDFQGGGVIADGYCCCRDKRI
jgi:hypothetical protein